MISEAGQQRQAEQQAEADGGSERFREVGRHRGDFAGDPHGVDQRAGEMRAAELREALAGDDAQLGRERLEQHRDQVGQQDDPQQQVAELRTALDVGGEVAGIHVGDRGDDRWAGERQEAAQAAPATGQRLAAGGDRAVRQACPLYRDSGSCSHDHTMNPLPQNVALATFLLDKTAKPPVNNVVQALWWPATAARRLRRAMCRRSGSVRRQAALLLRTSNIASRPRI